MNITPETKLGALLKEHPHLIEFLPTLSPTYENLKNPVLRRTMLGRATLEMVADTPRLVSTRVIFNLNVDTRCDGRQDR